MALNIKINFEDRYGIYPVNNVNYTAFDTELVDGTKISLGIKISTDEHPLMRDVYNLGFGPFIANNEIDDQAKLTHKNHSKVFSTIVFEGLSFLSKYPDRYLGIDGSTTARAYMYYRCIQNNYDFLTSYFVIYGVNYYARILREEDSDYESEGILALPKLIEKGEVMCSAKLYNYFIFKVK